MNPNLPQYGLSSGPNLHLLDNMLMAAGFQATDQPGVPKPGLVPQYTYSQDNLSMHHHTSAMNLVQAQPHSTASDPVHVIVYQNEAQQQQQPISYKIPQLGTVVQQEQGFVVNEQAGQLVREQEPQRVQYTVSQPRPAQLQTVASQSTVRHVQSPAERKKDIVAQAIQEQNIFEESLPKAEPVVKQEQGVAPNSTTTSSTTTTCAAPAE